MLTYGEKAGNNPSLDPFIITSTKLLDLCLMNNAGLTQASRRFAKDLQKAINSGDMILLSVRSRTRKNLIRKTKAGAFWKRLYMAVFGGFAVVGPMLIMVLYKHILTSLLTTPLVVFLFALAMAMFSTANPERDTSSCSGGVCSCCRWNELLNLVVPGIMIMWDINVRSINNLYQTITHRSR
jgi:hypothetical protein